MNRELHDLLGALGLPDAASSHLWRRVIMVNNYGSIPERSPEAAARGGGGFQLLCLDRKGRSTHYAKCRLLSDPAFERECTVLEALGSEADVRELVLPARVGATGHLRMHLSPYLREPRYDRVIVDESPEEWQRSAEEIIQVAARICDRVAASVPSLAPEGKEIDLSRAVGKVLERLERSGLDRSNLTGFQDALEGVRLPARIQHGDLWPGNVLRKEDGWRLLDFERFGVVQVPLFDVFHFLWGSAWKIGKGEIGPWLPLQRPDETAPWKRASQDIIRAQADRVSLGPKQVGAALIYSVLETLAHRRRPGLPAHFSEPLMPDLRFLTDWISAGRPLGGLVRSAGPTAA